MPTIDYAAQFLTIDQSTADEMTATWKKHRTYTTARAAFTSAQRTENRGIDVAFARTPDGVFHVWAEQRDEAQPCSGCANGDRLPTSACEDCGVFSCSACWEQQGCTGCADDDDQHICFIDDTLCRDCGAPAGVEAPALSDMVAVKCVGCAHLVTDPAALAHLWNVDTSCPACGDGALLWDDGSLHLT